MGFGFGTYFVSDSVHNYIKTNVRNNPLSYYMGLAVNATADLKLNYRFNLQASAEILSSVNYSGNLLRKYPLFNLQAGLLPGIHLYSDDTKYTISAGVYLSKLIFNGNYNTAISYRAKLSINPYVNSLVEFDTIRGIIIFDYSYTSGYSFNIGQWGIQIGSEFLLF